MELRKFHIWDFPEEPIYIYLKESFKKELFKNAIEEFESQVAIADFLDTTRQSVRDWYIGDNSTSLSKTIKLFIHLKNKESNFIEDGLEENIIAFKGPSNSLKIKVRLPIVEDERMIRILFHLLGDGYGGEKLGAPGLPFYRNTSQSLLDSLEKDLNVFGEIPVNRYKTRVQFPKVIGYLLKHFYVIEFETYKSSIPKYIFKLPKKLVAQGVQAFVDDEGGIEDSRIRITSYNKGMLRQLKELIQYKFPTIGKHLSKIRTKNTKLRGKLYTGYTFSILSDGLKKYIKIVGSRHEEKSSLMEDFLKRKSRGWNRRNEGSTKLLILQALKDGGKTVKELSKLVGITTTTTRAHINGSESSGISSLKKKDLVEQSGIGRYNSIIWEITEKGLSFLEKNKFKIKYFSKNYSIDEYYLKCIRKSDNPVTSSNLAKEIEKTKDQVAHKLLNLYRKGFLEREKHEKNKYEFKYELTDKGIKKIES